MDERWEKLVESVLSGVELNATARRRLYDRLDRNGDLAILYGAWLYGGDDAGIGRILAHLADLAR